ncbi:phosphonate C-P lyase system protein PhnL [uncultured Rhodospira sp.]|uniref:phosphonate C-P lyase system protein PhnL n=1 Tax=uncultured Rhodospira sp. TaxID=1936189 RepID=UPI0026054AB5|nr:phosphonate C-P lyase system protein PhnL [uncultured Rhodospira sp.]
MTDPTQSPRPMIRVEGLSKAFVLHTQGGARIPVFDGLDLTAHAGECVALHGPSGAGKSTLLRALYANYRPGAGHVWVRHGETWVDMVTAPPRVVIDVRRRTMGHVSQFLRVIPRVPALDVVAEPLVVLGESQEQARRRAGALLTRLNIPERLWSLAPATFSGGEQQRVNVARGFIAPVPVLLLDEPTASLDKDNRDVVVALIREARDAGAAVVGIFHDATVREAVCDRLFTLDVRTEAA